MVFFQTALLAGYAYADWAPRRFGARRQARIHAVLAAISVLTLVLPNFTDTLPGPYYSATQLAAIAVVSLVLYGTFALVQGSRHRDHFVQEGDEGGGGHGHGGGRGGLTLGSVLLLFSLGAVVVLAKALAPAVEGAVAAVGAPEALVGIIIAAVVLVPEGFAALRAAYGNRLQTSLNLALGSALASIGLTIPSVAVVSLVTGWPLSLGLDNKSMVLLLLSLFVAALSLGIDLGFSQPMEHVLRQCLIALRLAEILGLEEELRSTTYYSALLIDVGCHTDAHEQAKWFGDDIATKATKYDVDMRSVAGMKLWPPKPGFTDITRT